MTARSTTAAGVRGVKIDRHGPAAELNELLDVVRPSGIGMNFMAAPAGPPLGVLVDVHEMQVPSAVSESGGLVRIQVCKSGLVVAVETEAVFPLGIGRVEFRRIITRQDPPIIRAMRIMTISTVSALDRTVPVLIGSQRGFHVHDPAFFGIQFLVMTTQAKVDLFRQQKLREAGKMGIMAIEAYLLIVHGTVLCHGTRCKRSLVGMTVGTDRRDRGTKHCLVGRPVGTVAKHAGLFDGSVDRLLRFHPLLLVGMTSVAECIAGLQQSVRMVALMVIMTAGAVSRSHRRMHHLVFYDAVGMALKTQLGHGLLQHCLVRRPVGIVTGGAIASQDRGMDHFFRVLRLVAHGTQSVSFLNERNAQVPRVFPGLRALNSLMTRRTRPVLDRAMHCLIFAHAGVTFCGDTGIGLCSSSAGNDEHYSKDEEYSDSNLLHHGLTP